MACLFQWHCPELKNLIVWLDLWKYKLARCSKDQYGNMFQDIFFKWSTNLKSRSLCSRNVMLTTALNKIAGGGGGGGTHTHHKCPTIGTINKLFNFSKISLNNHSHKEYLEKIRFRIYCKTHNKMAWWVY